MFDEKSNDSKLLRLMIFNPQKAMTELMDTYTGYVTTIVRGRLRSSEEDIEECVADVFIDFYKNYRSIDIKNSSIKSYLATIAHRRAIDKFRKTSAICSRITDSDTDIEAIGTDITFDPEAIAIKEEEQKVLMDAIKDLGEPDTTIIFRRYFLYESVSDIANALDMKSNTVTKRISRALETLKERMEKFNE